MTDGKGAAPPKTAPNHQNTNTDQDAGEGDFTDCGGTGEATALSEYLLACFGEAKGYAIIGLGHNVRRLPSGRYEYKPFKQIAIEWPASAEPLPHTLIEAAQKADVHICPYLMQTTERSKGGAVERRQVHADLDNPDKINHDRLLSLVNHIYVVESGSPEHYHIYCLLTRSVSQPQHAILCRGLAAYIGGADEAKHSDNDLLRPPGTLNRKATVAGDEPSPVTFLIRPHEAQPIDPEKLAEILGVDLDAGEKAKTNGQAKSASSSSGDRAETEKFDLSKFPEVRATLHKDSGDRSADTYGVMAACYRAGLRFTQACWAVYQSPRLGERLQERKEDDEVDLVRVWHRAVDEEQREAQKNRGDNAGLGGFEHDVSVELGKQRVREEARRRLAIEKAGDAPPFEAMLLADTPLFSEESFRIEGLLPAEASMIVNAQHKTGKTTLILNMAHSLITGEPFLGKFRSHPVTGRVAILNFEVSGPQLGHWARQAEIPDDRLYLVNLRGRRNPFDYPDDLQQLAGALKDHEIESLIVDPFGQAYPGTNQDSSGEVGAWLAQLNIFTRSEVGAADLVVTVHAGWNPERARGSSALGDWPDSILYLTRDEKTDDRYLRATGRDVSLDEDKLVYDPDIRRLTLSGTGGRRQARRAQKEDKVEALVMPVYLYVFAHPGASTTDIINALRALKREGKLGVSFGFRDQDIRDAIELAETAGQLRREHQGEGKPILHYPLTTPEEKPGRGEGGDDHDTPDNPGQTPDIRTP